MQKIPYASAVGSLTYAQVCTRLDITFVVGVLGRYLSNPGLQHWKAVKCVMHCLKRTKSYMLTYQKSDNLEIIEYSNSDFLDVKTANAPLLDTYICWLEELSLGSLINRTDSYSFFNHGYRVHCLF